MAKAGRKKKEESIEVRSEELPSEPVIQKELEEEIITLVEESKIEPIEKEETFNEKVKSMPEVEFLNPIVLSDQAVKWEKYIAMYKYTPERFLERYPNHPNKRFIEELIAFKKS